jgi:hypothetical protein
MVVMMMMGQINVVLLLIMCHCFSAVNITYNMQVINVCSTRENTKLLSLPVIVFYSKHKKILPSQELLYKCGIFGFQDYVIVYHAFSYSLFLCIFSLSMCILWYTTALFLSDAVICSSMPYTSRV